MALSPLIGHMNLQDLHDDVLGVIIGFLTDAERFSRLTRVSVRFSSLAYSTPYPSLISNNSGLHTPLYNSLTSSLNYKIDATIEDVETMRASFRKFVETWHFGRRINRGSVRLFSVSWSPFCVFDIISEIFPNLETIIIGHVNPREPDSADLRGLHLFPKLSTLKIERLHLPYYDIPCHKLSHLTLRYGFATKPLTSTFREALESSKSIQSLVVEDPPSLVDFSKIESLEGLDIKIKFTEYVPFLERMEFKNLRTLKLDASMVMDFPHLGRFSSLTSLSLSGYRFRNFTKEKVIDLKNLRVLNIYNVSCGMLSLFSSLELEDLRVSLDINDALLGSLSTSDIDFIASQKKLKKLSIGANFNKNPYWNISPILPQLESFSISANHSRMASESLKWFLQHLNSEKISNLNFYYCDCDSECMRVIWTFARLRSIKVVGPKSVLMPETSWRDYLKHLQDLADINIIQH